MSGELLFSNLAKNNDGHTFFNTHGENDGWAYKQLTR